MANVTVSDLAESVGTSVERLLAQMKAAGLSHDSADGLVSDQEKQTLLAFLKASHGDTSTAPKKITLKRKTTTVIKSGAGSGRKTVNVEVRKKRTYVKRDTVSSQNDDSTSTAATPDTTQDTPRIDDAEQKRKLALEARREAERKEKERQQELSRQQEQERLEKEKSKAAKQAEQQSVSPQQKQATLEAESLKTQQDEKSKHGKKKDKGHVGGDFVEEQGRKTKVVRKGLEPARKSTNKVDISRLDDDYEEDSVIRPRRASRTARSNTHGFKKPTAKRIHEVKIPEQILVTELAQKMSIKAPALVKELIKLGEMATVDDVLDQEVAQLVVEELGHKPVLISGNALEEGLQQQLQTTGDLQPRAPVVTVMGHVDHGKTSLLDYIRNSRVAAGEAGGITQHIGAYRVKTDNGEITFLDTPGHAAFTAMRARGAQCTDVVILVVAADDGVMPQTEEAVQHARAAEVPIVVAINKCDKESADPDRIKNELSAKGVIPEDWGGDTQFINVSAHTGEGIDALLEAVLLQSELQELSAVVNTPAKGVVIESRVDKGRGVVATVLVQLGTLNRGDILLAGQSFGRVRAMTNERGEQVKQAGPSTPVELLGLNIAPNAGDEFVIVPNERRAREVAEYRAERERNEKIHRQQSATLENMFADMDAEEVKTLSVVVKTDVRGSLEAIMSALSDMGNDEVNVDIVSHGVGGINENDINLAITSEAIVIGFNVRADSSARKLAESEMIEIRYYSIIYQLLDEVKAALSGMLAPERVEEIVGIASVREVFRSQKFGQIAGSIVNEGTIYRNKPIRVLRDNVVIYEGELESLRRFKDDVNEVRSGTECGIGVKNYDVKVGDQIEVYEVKEIAREL